MDTYQSPHMEVVELKAHDVITTSALNIVEVLGLEQVFHWNNASEGAAEGIFR